MKSMFDKFKNGDFVKDDLERIKNFASKGNELDEMDNEYWFRAGFYINRNFNKNIVCVDKEDLNLNWYRKTKAMIENERVSE